MVKQRTFKCCNYHSTFEGLFESRTFIYALMHTCKHTHNYMHTHTCARTHTRTHAHTHTHAYTHTHSYTCTHTRACAHTHTHTHTHLWSVKQNIKYRVSYGGFSSLHKRLLIKKPQHKFSCFIGDVKVKSTLEYVV